MPLAIKNAEEMDRLTRLLFFSICAVIDFAWGWMRWHSLVAGVVAIMCALPLNALLFFAFRSRLR